MSRNQIEMLLEAQNSGNRLLAQVDSGPRGIYPPMTDLASILSTELPLVSSSDESLINNESIHDNYLLWNNNYSHDLAKSTSRITNNTTNFNNNTNFNNTTNTNNNTNNFDILPSYQMHQSILNRPLNSESDSASSHLPGYSATPSINESDTEDHSSIGAEFIDLHEGSVLRNINRLPKISSAKEIKISIKLDQSKTQYFSNYDSLSGSVFIENASKVPIPFEMFFVTFEGQTELIKDEFDQDKNYIINNFLRMVDLGASWTDADNIAQDRLRYDEQNKTFIGLPSNRILAPNTRYQRFFHFTIPSMAVDQCSRDSILKHLELPPSFGSAKLRMGTTSIDDQLFNKFSYEDFASSLNSINYSINAKLITISKLNNFVIKGDARHSIKFIPKCLRQNGDDGYLDFERFKSSPDYELRQLIRNIENDINEVQTTLSAIEQDGRRLVYDRRQMLDDSGGGSGVDDIDEICSQITNQKFVLDDSKRKNLYDGGTDESRKANFTTLSSLSTFSFYDDNPLFVPRYRKNYKFFRKKRKKSPRVSSLFGSKSGQNGDSRASKDSLNSDSGILSISNEFNDENGLILDFNHLSHHSKSSERSIPLTLDLQYLIESSVSSLSHSSNTSSSLIDHDLQMFFTKPDIDLVYVNVYGKGAPVPIELDPSWFSSKKHFNETVRGKFRSLKQKISSLPQGTKMYLETLRKMKAMTDLDFDTGSISKAFKVETFETSSLILDENTSNLFSNRLHLSVKIDHSKLKSSILVPDFQSCHLSRFYFLRLKFKQNPNVNYDYDIGNDDANMKNTLQNLDGNYKFYLDVPISIKKLE